MQGSHHLLRLLQRGAVPLAVLVVGILGLVALASLKASPAREEAVIDWPFVETAPITSASTSFPIHVHGVVVPSREVEIGAQVPGRIHAKSETFRAGTFVNVGDELLIIDPRPLQLQIKALESERKQLEVDLAQLDVEESNNQAMAAIAESDVAIAKREMDRLERLAKGVAASQSQVDQASSSVMKALNAKQTIENALQLMEKRRERIVAGLDLVAARIDQVQYDLDRTRVTAPIAGVVTAEMVELDSFVQPGQALLKIQDTSAVDVRTNLRVEDLYWLYNSSTVDFGNVPVEELPYRVPRTDAIVCFNMLGNEYSWRGTLDRYTGTGVDPKTRTVPCKITVPEPVRRNLDGGPQLLTPGMFVKVQLMVSPRKPLLRLPSQAVQPGNEVWSIEGDTLRVHSNVRVARYLEGEILVEAESLPLRPGSLVVVSPLGVAVDGMKIRVRSETLPAASPAEPSPSS